MEATRSQNNSLTSSQQQAVAARGNILVMAGAGTGKTKTLVERCLDCLERERVGLDELLIVTFTEAAAAEMRQRLRQKLEEKAATHPADERWPTHLALFDAAHIGTLHSFCLKLVREHFYELGLDPRFAVLEEGEARQRANEVLDEIFHSHYADNDELSLAVQNLIQIHGGGRDENIRKLVLRMHHYSQARPDAAGWLAAQLENFSSTTPITWQCWLLNAVADWQEEWLATLQSLGAPASLPASSVGKGKLAGKDTGAHSANPKAVELHEILSRLGENFTRETAAEITAQIISADAEWPARRKTVFRQPLEKIFSEAAFLSSLLTLRNNADPLAEDWSWVRDQMITLLQLAREFASHFAANKLADGRLDFHDLEQFALKLLWDFTENKPTTAAVAWRNKLQFVFVDEYQDINAAQDKIIQALSRAECKDKSTLSNDTRRHIEPSGGEPPGSQDNRFLVGDVKQSIYRFRLADPKIFRNYAQTWRSPAGQSIPLSENFRSREGLLHFVNSVCGLVMREEVGGVGYDEEARLQFGSPDTRSDLSTAKDIEPRVELLLRRKAGRNEASENTDGELADLDEAQKEARLVAARLKQLEASGYKIWDEKAGTTRPVEWRDITILLRSPSGKSEIFAKEFERAGIPLDVARGGFYESAEILDLLSLLQLLDNPLQDVPCIAVLRSPLVGLSLDELAEIRLATDGYFWTALNRLRSATNPDQAKLLAKIFQFLDRFSRWRKLAKQVSLSQCLEEILDETLYGEWLRAQSRGAQRAANVAAFLNLAQQFDQFQRQGLFRFLKFIEAQQEAETEPEVSTASEGNAVRLMSIHQSKGLEFLVVVLADLAKNFNEQDLRGEIIFDEELGLCPKVKPPSSGRRYPSLPHWLAQRRQRRELRGEELRLFYVALTRAKEHLILTATISEKKWEEVWTQATQVTVRKIVEARNFADWLALWFAQHVNVNGTGLTAGQTTLLKWRMMEDSDLAEAAAASDKAVYQYVDQSPDSRGRSPHPFELLDECALDGLKEKLAWTYPFVAATERKAKSSVTALRREAEDLDDEAEQMFQPKISGTKRLARMSAGPKAGLSAAQIGAAHHKFLQHVALEKVDDLAAEADRLARGNYLSAEERAALDLRALEKFWNSGLGRQICANAANVRRELPFTVRIDPGELDRMLGRGSLGAPASEPASGPAEKRLAGRDAGAPRDEEFVVVQGVADLVVTLPAEIWLVDFKTDEVAAGGLADKVKSYAPQLRLYAAALEKIFKRPVTVRALHFLALGQTKMVDS